MTGMCCERKEGRKEERKERKEVRKERGKEKEKEKKGADLSDSPFMNSMLRTIFLSPL